MGIGLAKAPGARHAPPPRSRRWWSPARIAMLTAGGAILMTLTILPLLRPTGWPFTPPFHPYFAPGTRLYVDPHNAAAQWVRRNPDDRRAAVIDRRIAARPQALWFTDPDPVSIRAQVTAAVADAARRRAIPVLVAYAIPHRDCGRDSAGGSGAIADYRRWIDGFAAGMGRAETMVILEPDALANVSCLSARQQADRYAALSYAARTLHGSDPRARVYYDAGNSNWQPARTMAKRLRAAGIEHYGNGIALNVSNFNRTHDEVRYGLSVLDRLDDGRLAMVVDTSRNGNGPARGRRAACDPSGRRIGAPPTTAPGADRVDAYLWIKNPGQADGCAAAAGVFVPGNAYRLAR
ncbi:MAG TPA: glycoside hydrolase family 6 protein [Streptosporangiaceae bacterium]